MILPSLYNGMLRGCDRLLRDSVEGGGGSLPYAFIGKQNNPSMTIKIHFYLELCSSLSAVRKIAQVRE